MQQTRSFNERGKRVGCLTAGPSCSELFRLPQEFIGLFQCFDTLVEKYGLEKIKTIGDCYMVAAGILESLGAMQLALILSYFDLTTHHGLGVIFSFEHDREFFDHQIGEGVSNRTRASADVRIVLE